MQQTRQHSAVEVVVNLAIGYVVAVVSQLVIFPVFGVSVRFRDNLLIGMYFTAVSLIRSYALRRWFTTRRARRCDTTAT